MNLSRTTHPDPARSSPTPTGPGTGTGRVRRSRAWPPNWPIRWKIAAVSAGLTFFILVGFGVVVGQIATKRLRENFTADTMSKAMEVARTIGHRPEVLMSPAYADDEAIDRLLGTRSNRVDYWPAAAVFASPPINQKPPVLGPLTPQTEITTYNGLQVATAPVTTMNGGQIVGWARFGRPEARLAESVRSIRFSIAAGILGATLLAALGSVVLSRRAMRPISTLTATAGEIARTRDPEVRLEPPVGDDEVAHLTRTFSEMLHELSISRAEEERLLRRQREFIADASHELRTPLTSVLANLELLEDSLRRVERPDDLDSVTSALRSSQRMRRLVADLQTLARIDLLQKTEFTSCDLTRIAAEATAELEPLSGQRSLVLKSAGSVPVNGAVDDLHRVAVNLIGNAIRHTPEGARIEIETSADPEAETATLRVSDEGPGIPSELRREIFDRFVRGPGPLDRGDGKGTGLGLAIVKAISESHGGTVEVGESDAGGAAFTVTLPLDTALEEPRSDAGDAPVSGSSANR